MESIIAVFLNRNQAMQFASMLKRVQLRSKIVNTPRELSVSCGVSVVFDSNALSQARMIIDRFGYRGSVKLYMVTRNSSRKYLPI